MGSGTFGMETGDDFENDTPRARTPLEQNATGEEDKDKTPTASKVHRQCLSLSGFDAIHARLMEILQEANLGDKKQDSPPGNHCTQASHTQNPPAPYKAVPRLRDYP